MNQKKGDSAPKPSIFHPDIFDPQTKKDESAADKMKFQMARPQSRLFHLTQKTDSAKE